MKKPIYSVIIPYLETVNNKPNTCLDLCIKYLKQNSKHPFEIIPISGYDYSNNRYCATVTRIKRILL
jgi:hypothetical protein